MWQRQIKSINGTWFNWNNSGQNKMLKHFCSMSIQRHFDFLFLKKKNDSNPRRKWILIGNYTFPALTTCPSSFISEKTKRFVFVFSPLFSEIFGCSHLFPEWGGGHQMNKVGPRMQQLLHLVSPRLPRTLQFPSTWKWHPASGGEKNVWELFKLKDNLDVDEGRIYSSHVASHHTYPISSAGGPEFFFSKNN